MIQAARRRRRTEARSIRARQAPAAATGVSDDGEHYIPPPPPPLPKLDSLAKGAWAALFGGPAYLVVATAAGWSVPGIAAFCAVAAFITGFAILVLRMNDPGPGGPDDGDDGAVVLRARSAAPHDARVLAQLRDLDLGERPVTAPGQRPLEGGPRGIKQQVARLGHAAADHEAGGIEDRGQVGQALAEPAADGLKTTKRGRIALGRGLRDHRAGNALGQSPA